MNSEIRRMGPDERKRLLEDVEKACRVMRDGGVILYPTDTVWGIGCDATNSEAVKKVFQIKNRIDSKALITLVPDTAWVERYVREVPEVAWELMDVAVDPLTIVYDHGKGLAPELMAADGSIAIRVTHEPYSSELCRRMRVPVVSTSANISGQPTPMVFQEINPEIIRAVDYVAEWRRDDRQPARPSSVIKIGSGGVFKILR